ncbi:MAG: hypothetical protein ABIG10_04190 [bacterium]
MSKYKVLLITRPDHDKATRYLSAWSDKIIQMAGVKDIPVFDLKRKKANKEDLTSFLKKKDPALVILNGHGNIDEVTGHNNKLLVKAGENEHILKGRIIYALSCSSALILGKKSISAGALSYIGYEKDFMLCNDSHKIARPLQDKVAKLFLEPSNQICKSLLKGNTCGKASENSKKIFAKNIRMLLSSDAPLGSSEYAKFLWWDMKAQVCLGDMEATF